MAKKKFSWDKILSSLQTFIDAHFSRLKNEDVALIKSTHFFDQLDEKGFATLLKKARRTYHPVNDLIVREGDVGDAFYIIKKGSVRVFTKNAEDQKIPLARLDEGAFFGEQALVGEYNKTRNASIESITPTQLIKIKYADILKIFKIDRQFINRLRKIGNKQVIEKLAATLNIAHSIEGCLLDNLDKNVIDVPAGTILFHTGDKADYVYFIMEGAVKIEVSDEIHNDKIVFLRKGIFFGELGVIFDSPRKGTASIAENARLVRIPGNEFKRYYQENPRLQQLLKSLKNIYVIPQRGLIEQFVGHIMGMEAVTTTYKFPNGRYIVASRTIEKDIFFMEEKIPEKNLPTYSYEKNADTKITLSVDKNRIVSLRVFGGKEFSENVVKIIDAIFEKKNIPEYTLDHFQSTGEFKIVNATPHTDEMQIICSCMSVTKETIEQLISEGINTIDEIANRTGACTVCCTCKPDILTMLGQNAWVPAVLTKAQMHNNNVISYYIEPTVGSFDEFTPGAHVMLQVKIDGNMIERPYTLSDFHRDGKLRITIKQEKEGYFTQWLFKHMSGAISLNCSQPQGKFLLKLDDQNAVFCIAGGIGITPFVIFAKAMQKYKLKKPMHLIYVAPTKDDFVFVDELTEVAKSHTAFTLTLWEKRVVGVIPEEKLQSIIDELNNPDIYICGPEGFESSLVKNLENLNFPKEKIYIEKFTYTSPKVAQ